MALELHTESGAAGDKHDVQQPDLEGELHTYRQAVQDGYYAKDTGGLAGKHDNVRRYWEDELTGIVVRDDLERLLLRKKQALERLRIVDLGCGSGEGYELLTRIRRRTSGVETANSLLVTSELINLYLGVDISQAMVDQGRETYKGNGKISFEQGDLREGLPSIVGTDPFDLYFSSYGSLSHLNDQELENLLIEIAQHAGEHALVVVDVLGRFSYEWQAEWNDGAPDHMRDYSMAYLHLDGEMGEQEIEHFPMRCWTRQELERLLARVSERSGRTMSLRRSFDRSILVGRHMDTALYNPKAPALRRVVNMLHESNQRTELRDLLFDYHPMPGYEEINRFLERMQMAWNLVVCYCIDRLSSDAMDPEHEDPDALPEAVGGAMKTIGRVIDNVRWMRMGDPRANIIEPQLAYALRSLETGLQQGQGYAHSLIGVVEITD